MKIGDRSNESNNYSIELSMLSISALPEEDLSRESAAHSGAIGNLGRMIPRFISSIRQDRRMTYLRACVCVCVRGESVCEKESEFICLSVQLVTCVCTCSYVRVCMFLMIKNVFF